VSSAIGITMLYLGIVQLRQTSFLVIVTTNELADIHPDYNMLVISCTIL